MSDHERRIDSLEEAVFGRRAYWGREGRSLESRVDDLETAIGELRERLNALEGKENGGSDG